MLATVVPKHSCTHVLYSFSPALPGGPSGSWKGRTSPAPDGALPPGGDTLADDWVSLGKCFSCQQQYSCVGDFTVSWGFSQPLQWLSVKLRTIYQPWIMLDLRFVSGAFFVVVGFWLFFFLISFSQSFFRHACASPSAGPEHQLWLLSPRVVLLTQADHHGVEREAQEVLTVLLMSGCGS